MDKYLSSANFPTANAEENQNLATELNELLQQDFDESPLVTLAHYQQILADNTRKDEWPTVHHKLETLFKCGTAKPLDGPMIGIPVSLRDSDYFKKAA